MLSHARLCRRSVGVHSMRRWQSHSSNASSRGVCPSCSSPLPTPLPTCPKCSHIEPLPSTTTLFDVFGLHGAERTFSLDSKDLKTRFLKAQRVCHPDAWSGKGESEQAIAAAQSSFINTAYHTLSSPLLRAQYILSRHGYVPSEGDKLTDEALIMEVMETREELDSATSRAEVEEIQRKNDELIQEAYKNVEGHIQSKEWGEAAKDTVRMKYLEGIESAIKEKLHTIL